MAVYLGIDLGTTGLKSLLVRPDGSICGSGYREYPLSVPAPGYAEQDPEDWWRALRETVAEALSKAGVRGEEIAAIGLSGQMHGTVLLGGDGRPLAPAIPWCDQRSAAQAAEIRARIGAENLARWTQNPVGTGFQICSLLWIRENQPHLYRKVRRVLLPKDYVRFRLTGQTGTEPTDACSTLMFDCAQRDWSRQMLEAFDIDRALLPDANHLPTEIHGGLTEAAARELGLKPGTPVVFGGGDQPMQAVGNGILAPGDIAITLGTGGQIFMPTDRPVCDPALRVHSFCRAPSEMWYVMGAILNCCLAQNWFFDKVLGTRDFAAMHRRAADVAPGCGGLLFLPYLTGERTPYLNPQAKGVFFGLTLGDDEATLARAVIEGISHALLDAMLCIRELIPAEAWPSDSRLIVSGGGARSGLWRQILADMFGQPIYATAMCEEAGTGAAICAMVGAGEYASLSEACEAIVRYEDGCVTPIPENTAVYHERHAVFQELYAANRGLFNR